MHLGDGALDFPEDSQEVLCLSQVFAVLASFPFQGQVPVSVPCLPHLVHSMIVLARTGSHIKNGQQVLRVGPCKALFSNSWHALLSHPIPHP